METRKPESREPSIDLEGRAVASVRRPNEEAEYPVRDGSYERLFLESAQPLALRTLVPLELEWGDGDPVELMGLVAHQRSKRDVEGEEASPGMGLHLFATDREARRRWRGFIREQSDAPDRPRPPHVTAQLPDDEALESLLELDSAPVRLFVRNAAGHDPGTAVVCDLVHPDGEASCQLSAEVVDRIDDPPRKRGIELEFQPPESERLEALEAFVLGDSGNEAD